MCTGGHTGPLPAGVQSERLASDRRAVSDPIAFLLVFVATAVILALAGLAIAGVLSLHRLGGRSMSQGQIVSGLIAAAGVALLVLALVRAAPSRVASVKARVRSTLVDALMMAAGLALLLVQRLDPTALPRVLAGVKAAMRSAIVAQRSRR